jgi:2,3-bisphosphoglycerate-independent phosphoglycerate mutase
MDRDNRWDRVALAYARWCAARRDRAPRPPRRVEAAYAEGKTDEFIARDRDRRLRRDADGRRRVLLNFRADRAREILRAIGGARFRRVRRRRDRPAGDPGHGRLFRPHNNLHDRRLPQAPEIVNTLGAWVAQHGLRQFRLAETEKYPHVTFFLNGGKETPEEGEDRYMAPSPKVATYDLRPR